jgi:hypothetical protein
MNRPSRYQKWIFGRGHALACRCLKARRSHLSVTAGRATVGRCAEGPGARMGAQYLAEAVTASNEK